MCSHVYHVSDIYVHVHVHEALYLCVGEIKMYSAHKLFNMPLYSLSADRTQSLYS